MRSRRQDVVDPFRAFFWDYKPVTDRSKHHDRLQSREAPEVKMSEDDDQFPIKFYFFKAGAEREVVVTEEVFDALSEYDAAAWANVLGVADLELRDASQDSMP